jgi:hypothetical protein
MIRKYFVFMTFLCAINLYAQDYFPKNDGVVTKNNNYIALTNAKIYVTATEIINNGTLLIKDDKIVASGASVPIPKNAITIDIEGKSIYPSFIDLYSSFGVEKPKRPSGRNRSAQYDASRSGYYWNDHVMPENQAISKFQFDNKTASELLKAGFGAVNTHIQDGIVRGTGSLVTLNSNDGNEHRIISENSGQYLSFSKSVLSNQSYPSSIMGSMALLRQLYIDADWYAN